MHPRIPLAFLATRAHCWLMVNFSTRTPRSLSTELLSSRSAPGRTGAWGNSSSCLSKVALRTESVHFKPLENNKFSLN